MGLIRKTLRVATLPAGPLGVKGKSKKQRVAARTAAAAEAQEKLLRDIRDALGAATGTVAAEQARATLKAELSEHKRELLRCRTAALKARRRGDKDEADEQALYETLLREEIDRLRSLLRD